MSDALILHRGGCHCGAVRFEIRTPPRVEVQRCNCSICRMTGFVHLIVPRDHFSLISGKGELQCYQFNTKTASHLFCRRCGIKSYYVPRSNPDGFSVNFNCLDTSRFEEVRFAQFDGQNWEQHAGELAHLSKSQSTTSRKQLNRR